MIKAVIFDVDGVLLDTERLEMVCSNIVLAEKGLHMSQALYAQTCSMKKSEYEQFMQDHFGADFDFADFASKISKLMNDRISCGGLKLKEGADIIPGRIKEMGLRLGIATSTARETTYQRLKQKKLYSIFDAIRCGDEVSRSKPFPDIYLAAAHALGVNAKECIAVEDSRNGVMSAAAAGCMVIMVPDLAEPTADIRSKCATVADSLMNIPDIILKTNTKCRN